MQIGEFVPLMEKLAYAFKEQINEHDFDLYFSEFKNLSAFEFGEIVSKAIRTYKYFPKINELLSLKSAKKHYTEREPIPCYACHQITNGSVTHCYYPLDQFTYEKLIKGEYVENIDGVSKNPIKQAIRLYGTRNWMGQRLSTTVRCHKILLPEDIVGMEEYIGFRPSQSTIDFLRNRSKKNLETGPYYEKYAQ